MAGPGIDIPALPKRDRAPKPDVIDDPGLPGTGFVREWDILGDRKAVPPIPGVFLIGRSTWWAGVKSGRFPKPVKLGPRITAWRVEDIRALIESFKREGV